MALNDTQCRNAKPKDKGYYMGDDKGLGLFVRPTGVKSWQYRYRCPAGKQQVFTYGQYPALSLSEVRNRHNPNHQMTKDGLDPKVEALKHKLQSKHAQKNTFENIALQWHAKMTPKWTGKYANTILHRLNTDVFPKIGNLPISDITPLMIMAVMQEIEKRDVYEVQRRILQYIGQVFRYALPMGLVERDLTIEIFDTLRPTRSTNYASVDLKDFPEFLMKFHENKARSYDLTKLAFEMMMLTFLRTDELISLRWNEVDFINKRLIIPAERMKMKREHIVPLSNQALSILNRLKNINGSREYVFASMSKPKKSISNNTVLSAIYRMGYKGRMTGHGFRALATTALLENLGYNMPVIDVQLSHAKKATNGSAYDRALYLNKRIEMMQNWADYIDSQYIEGMKSRQHEF